MHADALTDHSVRGASVYTLALSASDAQSAALARRENSADRSAAPSSAAPRPRSPASWRARAGGDALGSARMARSVVGAFDGSVPLLQNPSRHADFAVLQAADIPSVLVEMGFMSNRADEAALRKPKHRAQVAAALREAIDAYFAGAPTAQLAG